MIGFYDYTVILTYLSLISASVGIAASLNGGGHPFIGCFFLLFCGFCDAFDGRVARSKPNRTQMECNYGIQIDSLCDLVAFGVLPACIGVALIRRSTFLSFLSSHSSSQWLYAACTWILFAVLVLYTLAAMIRLAYFNVTEEERQKTETGCRKYYVGLPVTSSSLIFPGLMLLQYLLQVDIVLAYAATALITAIAFLAKFHIRKPGLRGILVMVLVGSLECVALLVARMMHS